MMNLVVASACLFVGLLIYRTDLYVVGAVGLTLSMFNFGCAILPQDKRRGLSK